MGLFSLESLIALITLVALEVILGIDNIIFMGFQVAKLPAAQRDRARKIGLLLAAVLRIGFVLGASYLARLTEPISLIEAKLGLKICAKDLVMLLGGLYLLWHSVKELSEKVRGVQHQQHAQGGSSGFGAVLINILLLDLVFSIDSVLTAVGMVRHVEVMIIAILVTVAVMLWASRPVIDFVQKHPDMQILALAFLILIGVLLLGEGMGHHIPKGYIYFAMFFALGVNIVQLKMEKNLKGQAPN